MTDLFDGQPQGAPEYAVFHAEDYGSLFAGYALYATKIGDVHIDTTPLRRFNGKDKNM